MTLEAKTNVSQKITPSMRQAKPGQEPSVRVWENEQNTGYLPHRHLSLEMILPIENGYDVEVDDTYYHLLEGDIMLIPSSMLHSCTPPSSGRRYIYLFDLTILSEIYGFAELQPVLSMPLHITPEDYPSIYEDVYQLLIQIRTEYINGEQFAPLTTFSLMLNLLVKLGETRHHRISHRKEKQNHKQREYLEKFNSVMNYIDAHYTEELSLDEMAASIAFSKYHFSRLFKEYTNYTFCGYITSRRIKAAETLLAKPELSIAEIALHSGFSSISTFNRVFKQQLGCTPSEYREQKLGSQ